MPTALEEKDAIREVLAEYCFRLDGGRYDEMAALFTEDGTWDTAFGKGTGRAGIVAQAESIGTPCLELVSRLHRNLCGMNNWPWQDAEVRHYQGHDA